jgi:hypothetical protein
MDKRIVVGSALVFSLLSACGGGGGGSAGGVNSTPTPPPAGFSSFAAVQTGASTLVGGDTREGSLQIENTGAILQQGVTTPTEGTGSATFTLNSARQITGLTISGAQSSVVFDGTSTSETLFRNGVPVATAVYNTSGSNQALYGDPYALGFNYQTFGVWGTGLVTGQSGKFGAISVGAKTNASAVPTTGSITYRGYAGGIYTDGATYRYAADATFDVNFGSRSIAFSTRNQTLTSVLTGVTSATGMLQMSGVMTYGAGSTKFSGNLTANGLTSLLTLSGTGSGTFYGPTANELGGTFFLRGPTTTLVGGFGGKQ